MFIIVGLGNPGKKFEKTRHNFGFWAINEIATYFKFPIFDLQTQTSKGEIADQKAILVKPQTFMNQSGKAVKKIISNLKNKHSEIIIIHDDIDLPLGKIKIVRNKGAGGHKGVQSIINEIKTKNFIRIRMGIGPQKMIKPKIKNFVLKNFTKKEQEIVKLVIKKIIEITETIIKYGIEKAMNKYNCD